MISEKMQQAVAGSSAIRAMFQEGRAMAAKIGAENVFDFIITMKCCIRVISQIIT